MIRVTYTAECYSSSKVERRYVRFDGNQFIWCEVQGKYDVRQGVCSESDLPGDVADAAKQLHGRYPSYTYWPL